MSEKFSIIIDGNNLIHKSTALKKLFMTDKESAMRSMIEMVESRVRGSKIIFVFDGHDKALKPNVIFSKDKTADEVIRKKIENSKNHRNMKIVSSDNNIVNLARACGCVVVKSEDFWKELSPEKNVTGGKNINQNYIYDELEKPGRMSKREIDEFRKYFT